MSSQIALNKTSGGQMIITPEDGTTTETITIPSVGVGKVLQYLSYRDTTQMNTSAGSWTDTPLSLSITPTSTDSKIVVDVYAYLASHSSGAQSIHGAIKRNGTVIWQTSTANYDSGFMGHNSTAALGGIGHGRVVDENPSAGVNTYTFAFLRVLTGNIVYYNNGSEYSGGSTITVMEVAA